MTSTKRPFIWGFHETEHLELIGGKAAHLGTLYRHHLPIAPGFCLTTYAFDVFIKTYDLSETILDTIGKLDPENWDDLTHQAQHIQSLILNHPLPAEIKEALLQAYEQSTLKNDPVAVRSSAALEDSPNASFAGQHDTFLNICGFSEILSAIQRCWASLYSIRALAYHVHLTSIDPSRTLSQNSWKMAVIVQKMIPADVSGVLFTADPKTGNRKEVLIDAISGLGEALVSGQASAKTFRLKRRFGHLQLLPAYPEALIPQTNTPAPNGAILSEQECLKLGHLGVKIEQIFKTPQDIEWCLANGVVYLLQARPITSLQPTPYKDQVIWTRRFSGERWMQPVTLLGWSVMQQILHHFTHFPRTAQRFLKGSQPTRLREGHIYFNITILIRLLVKFPGSFLPEFILELLPEKEKNRIVSRRFLFPSIPFLLSMFMDACLERMWGRYDWNILANDRHWKEFIPEFETRLSVIQIQFKTHPSTEKCLNLMAETYQLALDYIRIHLMSLAYSNLFYQGLGLLLKHWLGDHEDRLRAPLVSGLANNMTLEINKEIWMLSREIQKHPDLLHLFQSTDPQHILANLKSVAPEFMETLNLFLEKFGHRSHASWEIFAPRWAEDPTFLFRIIQDYLKSDGSIDPFTREQGIIKTRETLTQQIDLKLHQKWYDRIFPIRSWILRHILSYAQRYMATRENQRFYFDKLVFLKKRLLQRMLKELSEKNRLTHPDDGTFLTFSEVEALLNGQLKPEEAAQRIAIRKVEHGKYRAEDVPVFLLDEQPIYPEKSRAEAMLSGLGVSPGRYTGKVKILRDIAEAAGVSRGEILVTHATDPGWTPLFLKIGGIVMELGSLLSHGAVVAREYNLPAVVNVTNATSRLQDGQIITIDGSEGSIYLHSK